MLNITYYYINANQNHNEVSSHTSQNGHHQKVYKQSMLEWVWKKGNPLALLWKWKLIQPLWKTVWRFLRKLGIKSPYDPAIPLLGIYPEETKIETDTCIPLFIATLFTIARTWKPEKAMAPQSSTLAWKIPGTGEPGELPSMGSHRVRHDWSDLAAAAARSYDVSGIRLQMFQKYRL